MPKLHQVVTPAVSAFSDTLADEKLQGATKTPLKALYGHLKTLAPFSDGEDV